MTWRAAFRDLPREHGLEPLRVEGVIPADLSGTLYRCGPALFACAGVPYRHWFDGDGAVTAVRFDHGGAWGAVRVVETPGLLAERRAGKPLHAAYGTLPPGPRRPFPRPKNCANTSVLSWDRRLFALHESGRPIELDLEDLRTLGERDLGGVLAPDGFSAHPRAVRGRDALYNFSVNYGRQTQLELFELRGGGSARRLGAVPLSGPTMVHDFAATERYLVFFAPPLRLEIRELASGFASYSDALAWRPELGTEILIVPIDDLGATIRLEVESFYQWHFANAFERAGKIIVDFVRYPDFSTNRWFASLITGRSWTEVRQGMLARATIDPVTRTFRVEARSDDPVELPRVSPLVETARHRYVYAAAHSSPSAAVDGPHDRLVRLDVERGGRVTAALGDHQYPSEPIFVPRGGDEDDGWLLALVYDAATDASHVAVLDAQHVETGPVARAWFDHHVPLTFHGSWVARQ